MSRRQVLLAGLAAALAPAALSASPARPQTLVLCGRATGRDGKPLAGALIAAGAAQALTDAHGRFVLVIAMRDYRGVTCDGRPVEGFVCGRRREVDGTWRATVGLTVA